MHSPKKTNSITKSPHNNHKSKDPKMESLNDETTSPNKQQNINNNNPTKLSIQKIIKNADHPCLCIFLVTIKCLTLFSFIILDFFLNKETIYIIVIVLGACDFWITKNIAGRRLVGLRWWNEVKENGEEVWIFESRNNHKESNSDKNIFWTLLYINTGLWLIIFLYEIITLTPTWAIISLAMLIFASINLYGYYKCSEDQQRKIKLFSKRFAMNIIQKGFSYKDNINEQNT